MEALILSRFDPIYGPKIFLKAPKDLTENKIKDIPSLMELRPKGVFIHIFEELKTANLFFKVPSEHARGGNESFLISIITDINSDLKLTLARELLESFAKELINLEDAFKAFDMESKDYKGDPNKLRDIESLFFSFFKSIKPAIKTIEMAEYRYQALFKAARDAILIIDRNLGIIIDANEEAENLFDQPREDIIGLHSSQLKMFNQEILDPMNLRMENSPLFKKLRRLNGRTAYMEVSRNEIQYLDLIQVIFHDITELKIAEQKLKTHAKNIEILNQIITLANQAENLFKYLDKVLDSIIGFLNLDGCCIYLIDNFKKKAHIKAHKGFPSNFIENNRVLIIEQNPYRIIFLNGVALFNDNFPEMVRELLKGTEFISAAIVPLFSKFEIIGAIFMVLRNQRLFSIEEKDLLISIILEIGTAIEKMKNAEFLLQSEVRNNILLNHLLNYIPYSIFRISKKGRILDIKLAKKIEKIFNDEISLENLLGKNIRDFLPLEVAEKLKNHIEQALEKNESNTMKFILPVRDEKVIFKAEIIPIGEKEVLTFLKNVSRIFN